MCFSISHGKFGIFKDDLGFNVVSDILKEINIHYIIWTQLGTNQLSRSFAPGHLKFQVNFFSNKFRNLIDYKIDVDELDDKLEKAKKKGQGKKLAL